MAATGMPDCGIASESDLALVAAAVAGRGPWAAERLAAACVGPSRAAPARAPDPDAVIEAVRGGGDPLGDAFIRLRPSPARRAAGAVYTPAALIAPMMSWLGSQPAPARIVDAGNGSGRLLLAAGRRFAGSALVGVESDPLAALVCMANLTAAGLDERAEVLVEDYRTAVLPAVGGLTAFVGNPPYVRHHSISAEWKAWLRRSARALGLRADTRAGMHAHFIAATALHASRGDVGCLILPAEWRGVHYGGFVQRLLLDALGAVSAHSIDPRCEVFEDVRTTAMLVCFEVGERRRDLLVGEARSVAGLGSLDWGHRVPRDASPLLHGGRSTGRNGQRPANSVELGEICRVRRGALTGSNAVWVTDPRDGRIPQAWLLPCVTRARELFDAEDGGLSDAGRLRRIVALPRDLDGIEAGERARIEDFLRDAAAAGAADGFVARHRGAWWSVEVPGAAPILATYMARRPPAFVRNLVEARHLNIAHGLYPRHPLSPEALDLLAGALRDAVTLGRGRAYAGGLTKFEPSDLARVPVPADVAEGLLAQSRLPLAPA